MTPGTQEATQPRTVTLGEQILASLQRVRALLEGEPQAEEQSETAATMETRAERPRSPLSRLSERFELSKSELDILLFCAAVELDPQFTSLIELAHGNLRLRQPTFHLLLNLLPDANWNALLPQKTLRRWRLIDIGPGETLTTSPIRIDENVLHFLMGGQGSDVKLEGLLRKVSIPRILPQSYRPHAEKLVRLWSSPATGRVVAQLTGNGRKGKIALAAAACAAARLGVRTIGAENLFLQNHDRESFIRILERDSSLNEYVLLIDAENAETAAWDAVSYFADRFEGLLIVSGVGRLSVKQCEVQLFLIEKPSAEEQSSLWHHALGEQGQTLNGDLDRLSEQFSLDLSAILSSAERVLREWEGSGGELRSMLWEACRNESRPVLEGLARKTETKARWKDIVLPEGCLETLRTIVFQMRQRNTVLERWGFATQSSRGLGTAALFHGPSGSGKTLAAEILANELSLDLFHIDLSQIVSKYIGETEKNLRCIFDAAEDTGAILLFDEADALFGKRTEVKDAHDRFAEINFLLQCIRNHRGLVILVSKPRPAVPMTLLRRFSVYWFPPDRSS